MIPVAFITDENFIMQTGVAIYSLIQNKNPETEYVIYVIMAECSEEGKKRLRQVEKKDISVHIIEASLDLYRDIKQLSHIPISCLLKFNLCDLITAHDKIIYLDGDIYVRGDLSGLYNFDLGENFLAGVPSLDMVFDDRKLINAGVLLFDAKKMRDSQMSKKLIAKRRELGDRGSMDQQTFNLIMSDKIGFLPFQYNCIPQKLLGVEKRSYPVVKLNELYGTSFSSRKEMVTQAAIIHFATGGKPWKYSYIKCADEWYQCYLKSPYANDKLKRETALQAHCKGIVKHFRKNGVRGILNRLIWYVKSAVGKNVNDNWG